MTVCSYVKTLCWLIGATICPNLKPIKQHQLSKYLLLKRLEIMVNNPVDFEGNISINWNSFINIKIFKILTSRCFTIYGSTIEFKKISNE